MKVGIASPYFQTFGGGERYILTVAEFFQNRGDQVTIFWQGKTDSDKIRQQFDINLDKVKFTQDIFGAKANFFSKILLTSSYDLFFYLSDGSLPTLFAKHNILHFQTPFKYTNQKNITNKIKLAKINTVVCNSHFTKKYIDDTYGVTSVVVYPPVDVDKFKPGKKENIILSVGRFFGPFQPKKQQVMVATFKKMLQRGLKNWRLVLAGGLTATSEDHVSALRDSAQRLPIEFHVNSTFQILQQDYSKAKIYWHAAGYGEDLGEHPDRAEHFGITTVEAMSAGCAPVVFAAGGQLEILQENYSGFFWKTTDQLIGKTTKLINNRSLLEKVSQSATQEARKFSKQKFYMHLERLIS